MAVAEKISELKGEYGEKAAKYLAVSAFNLVFGQTLIVVAHKGFEWGNVPSNIFAVMVSAFPAYVLSRRWIWQKKGNNHFWKEVVPFWSMAFLGLGLSTIFAYVAEQYSDSTLVLMFANLSAFGLLWVAKFFILDKIMFGKTGEPITDDAIDALVDEVLHHKQHEAAEHPE